MPSAEAVALEHYRSRRRIVEAIAKLARSAWREVVPDRLTGSWASASAQLMVELSGAQLATAQAADGYLEAVLNAQGIDPVAAGRTVARSLAGVASDGRSLAVLLGQPMIATKIAIAGGATTGEALATGYSSLDMIVRTQAADAGRVADQVALTSRRHVSGYTRMAVGNSCSRCLILAGRWYRWNAGFNRHPNCDCVGIPARESADDLRTNPRKAFDAMSEADQDKTFGKAGAQAIREGADMARVVNARRGMQTAADGRLYTTEAAGKRPRLMPEQIYRDAKDRDDAIRLLRLHGFIL